MAKLEKGMTCPNGCGRLKVIETKNTGRGLVVRRRCCPVCNYRVTTDERRRTAK